LAIAAMSHTEQAAASSGNSVSSAVAPQTSLLPALDSSVTPISSSVSPLTTVDWAEGAYSTTTGLSSQSVVYTNLAASYSVTGVTVASFEDNAPVSSGGSFTCSGSNYNIAGFLIQISDSFSEAYNSGSGYPDFTVIVVDTAGTGVTYSGNWASTLVGSGPITETIKYTTYDSITGWWVEMIEGSSTYYLYSVSNADGIYFPSSPAVGDRSWSGCPGTVSNVSISSIGTTTTALTVTSSLTLNPSIAFEVNEASSGDFLSDNSNLCVNANVTSDAKLVESAYGGVTHFGIGPFGNNPASTAYLSGFTYMTDNNHAATLAYYDEFGTKSGIQNYIDNEWYVSGAATTQSSGVDLPTLNGICTGNTCPLVSVP